VGKKLCIEYKPKGTGTMIKSFQNNLFPPFQNLNIRNKLLVIYSFIIFLAIALSSIFIYINMKTTIETNIESELHNSTTTILNMVRTSAAVSLKNYLRAVAEKNRQLTNYFYDQYRSGILTESEAKARAAEILLHQTIGKFGYLYCINSEGVLVIHPKKELEGVNISSYKFAREQKRRKRGYLEYDWKNPGETSERAKGLYMTWFEPWDWIISVSAYREEFHELVNVDDFRESILTLRFGKTGYSYVIDTTGKLVIHPKMEQENIYDVRDADGRYFIREICERKSGKILYSWKNPDEEFHREKFVIFNHIPEFNWIVASSSYLEEFYAPLKNMTDITFIAIFVSLFFMLPVIIRFSASITNPMEQLMKRFEIGASGNFSVRMKIEATDEIGQLAGFFNTFMERLEKNSTSLKEEIRERKQVEQALRSSEEMFYKAFNSSPNAISITTLKEQRFINVNDSFLQFSGYQREEVIDKTFRELRLFPSLEKGITLLEILKEHGRIRDHEIEVITKTGEKRTGVMSAEIIDLWYEECMLSNIADVTETRRLETEIMNAGEKERRRIGQDLHDDLCPHLIGIEVLTKVLKRKLEDKSIGEADQANKIRELIREAIGKTRGLTRGLMPVYLTEHGLESALKEVVRNVTEVYGIPCALHYDTPIEMSDNTVATHLFYIIQEALHNAVKHANAENIRIDLFSDYRKIFVEIADDGVGIQGKTSNRGMGMRIMGFRAKKIDAALDIRKNDEGTTVSIAIRKSGGKKGGANG
jgi:PAS domain S-box-containing protein